MDRRTQREKALHSVKEATDSKIRNVQAMQKQRNAGVEAATASMEHQFQKEMESVDQKATQLLEKYGLWTDKKVADPDKESKPLPCLGPRAHWLDCQLKYNPDSRPCKSYVEALEECVRQTLATSAFKE